VLPGWRVLRTAPVTRNASGSKREEAAVPPSALPGTDKNGMPLCNKVMVYTSDGRLHRRTAVHGRSPRAAREGMSGATTHRGYGGFQGDQSSRTATA